MMMMSCEHNGSVSAEDGWRQLTSLDGEREEKKVVLSARPAELWDSQFDGATFHRLLGFRSMQSALCSRVNCGKCLQVPMSLEQFAGSYVDSFQFCFGFK